MTHTPRSMLALLLLCMMGGCQLFGTSTDSAAMTERLENAPPVMGSTLNDRHLLVMQAPNPGWSYQIDQTDRESKGWVVSITIRQPNPAFMYPQRIVEKRLLTSVGADEPMRVRARLLEHDEPGTNDDYAPLTLVDSFSP